MSRQLPASAHQHLNARGRVIKDRKGCGKFSVKLWWGVVGDQDVKWYSVMDLGQDSPVLRLHIELEGKHGAENLHARDSFTHWLREHEILHRV